MAQNSKRLVVWLVVASVVGAIAVLITVIVNAPVEFQTVHPRRGEIRESFEEPARTRLDRTWLITMPVAGRIGRINLEPGDPVEVGKTLVEFDRVPFEQAVAEAQAAVQELTARVAVERDTRIEQTALVQSRAAVKATEEAVKAAEEQVKAERARADRAAKEFKRMSTLAQTKNIPETVLDDARLEAETSLIDLRERQFNQAATKAMAVVMELMPKLVEQYIGKKTLQEKVLTHQLTQARARLAQAEHDLGLAKLASPITGVVLNRYEQGDSSLPAGQQLLLLGDLDRLEVIADVLTEDARKISPGVKVDLSPAAGADSLNGKVKRIEPAGFTKLSSLGVEQQRVNVIVAFDEKPEKIGVGYRLRARFYSRSSPNTLILNRYSVMQSSRGDYYVLKIDDGRLKEQVVKIGLKNDLSLEITEGLTETDVVIAQPDTTMKEGTRATPAK